MLMQLFYFLCFPFITGGFCKFIPYNNSFVRGFIVNEKNVVIKNNYINKFQSRDLFFIRVRIIDYYYIFDPLQNKL
jgi:hypothetical protein